MEEKDIFNSYLLNNIANLRILDINTQIGDYENIGNIKYEIFLQNCIGDYLLFMDLSCDPIDDAINIIKLCENYDLIIGVRKNKHYNIMQKIASKCFYGIIKFLGNNTNKENYSDFCIISRKIIHNLLQTNDDIKLLRLVSFNQTFRKYEYQYSPMRYVRKNILESINLTIDLIIGQSYKLIRIGSILSLIFALFNCFYAIYIIMSFIFSSNIAQGWTSTSIYLVTMNCALFLMLSIIGEYIRILLVKQKGTLPYEIINERNSVEINFHGKNIDKG